MKILLNILPAEKKTDMRRNVRFRMIIAHGSAVIFLGFLYSCALLGISFLLSLQLASSRGPSGQGGGSSNENEVGSYETMFRETNAWASEVSSLVGKHLSWGRFFRSLETATPEGVFFDRLATKTDYTIALSGRANNRESLLLLEKNMNDSDCFRDAAVPLSDKLVKENIDFQLDAVIEKSCLVAGKSQ